MVIKNIFILYLYRMKIALLLSGNLRQFFRNNFLIAKMYSDLVKKQNIDVFIYTDNNDFFYNDIQYFSENNKEKSLGIPANYDKRYHKNNEYINFENSSKIIEENILNIFNISLKDFFIENFDSELIHKIYDKNNINHITFMNNNFSNFNRKKALMCQSYKLYKCYNLLKNYEQKNNFKYDIIIKSRFDVILTDLNNYDIKTFDLTNNFYCYKYDVFINDVWGIGNRYIMDKYCNYYLNISSNMVEGTYCFTTNTNSFKVFNSKNNIDIRLNNIIKEDASDSVEFGLTYIINKNNYNIIHLNIHEQSFKFYNS